MWWALRRIILCTCRGPDRARSPQGPTRAQGRAQGPGPRAQGRAQGPGPDARAKRALDSSIYIYIHIYWAREFRSTPGLGSGDGGARGPYYDLKGHLINIFE